MVSIKAEENIIYSMPVYDFNDNKVIISKGILSSGFECFDNNFVLISGKEIFSNEKVKRKNASLKREAFIVITGL